MKKILIASLVGALIMFVYSALSWMVLPTHHDSFHYTPAQDSILSALKNAGLTDGAYYMPTLDNRNVSSFDSEYHKKGEEMMKANIGKPMATVFYLDKAAGMDPMQMVRGFFYTLIALFCVCMLLSLAYQSDASFFMRWWMVMLIAIIYTMMGPLMGHNWMMEPWHYTKGFICDAFIGWGLTGLWLAKYLKKA